MGNSQLATANAAHGQTWSLVDEGGNTLRPTNNAQEIAAKSAGKARRGGVAKGAEDVTFKGRWRVADEREVESMARWRFGKAHPVIGKNASGIVPRAVSGSAVWRLTLWIRGRRLVTWSESRPQSAGYCWVV
jgi:hypothetical protein